MLTRLKQRQKQHPPHHRPMRLTLILSDRGVHRMPVYAHPPACSSYPLKKHKIARLPAGTLDTYIGRPHGTMRTTTLPLFARPAQTKPFQQKQKPPYHAPLLRAPFFEANMCQECLCRNLRKPVNLPTQDRPTRCWTASKNSKENFKAPSM